MTDVHPYWHATGDDADDAQEIAVHTADVRIHSAESSVSRMPGAIIGIALTAIIGGTLIFGYSSIQDTIASLVIPGQILGAASSSANSSVTAASAVSSVPTSQAIGMSSAATSEIPLPTAATISPVLPFDQTVQGSSGGSSVSSSPSSAIRAYLPHNPYTVGTQTPSTKPTVGKTTVKYPHAAAPVTPTPLRTPESGPELWICLMATALLTWLASRNLLKRME